MLLQVHQEGLCRLYRNGGFQETKYFAAAYRTAIKEKNQIMLCGYILAIARLLQENQIQPLVTMANIIAAFSRWPVCGGQFRTPPSPKAV